MDKCKVFVAKRAGGDDPTVRKILILGVSGAGKSTVARLVGARLQLPVIHLDFHFWRPGWEMPDAEEWENCLKDFALRDAWIIDGNYVSSYPILMPVADLIVILDLPRIGAIYRVIKRTFLVRLGLAKQDGAPAGCTQKIDRAFLSYIWNFHRERQQFIDSGLNAFTESSAVHVFNSVTEMQIFIESIFQGNR